MLLKRGFKKACAGFKRKKVDALGSFQEIVKGKKKVIDGGSSFAKIQIAGGQSDFGLPDPPNRNEFKIF